MTAENASRGERIQTLWSGYGELFRVRLEGASVETVVVKNVAPPTAKHHPRGWNTDRSHERKLESYAVEAEWYRTFASRCDSKCRVPKCHGIADDDGEWVFLLEDLDASGFGGRHDEPGRDAIEQCLRWLANFHATFMGTPPDGLWPVGTYWHLATRPDELEAIADDRLREAAPLIDARLNACRFQTLVHGDAKVENFCFARDDEDVAAVDFQYVGGGCGMKDVAYFLSSCLTSRECERCAEELLDVYFDFLRAALVARGRTADVVPIEREWRQLYAVAWADFYRFLAGWSPGHWKIDRYSERMTNDVIAGITTLT